MKKLLLTVIAACGVLFVGSAFAEQRIGVINLTEIYSNSSYVKAANKQLQANFKDKQDELKNAQAKLVSMTKDYEQNKKSLAQDAQIKAVADIALQEASVNKMAQTYGEQIKQEQAQGMQTFLNKVRAAGQKVALAKGFDMIFTNNEAVYFSSAVDVTKDVQSAMS